MRHTACTKVLTLQSDTIHALNQLQRDTHTQSQTGAACLSEHALTEQERLRRQLYAHPLHSFYAREASLMMLRIVGQVLHDSEQQVCHSCAHFDSLVIQEWAQLG